MKRPALLITSLALNIVLAIVWAKGRSVPLDTVAIQPAASQVASPPEASPTPESATDPTNVITAAFHWSDVESTDYRIYLENLRAIGCPEVRIRDIIGADVDALFAARVRDYVAPLQPRFWEMVAKPRDLEKIFESHREALEKLEQEQEEIFLALFNVSDPHRIWRTEHDQTRNKARKDALLDFLDEAKRAAVVALEEELTKTAETIRGAEMAGSRAEVRKSKDAQQREAKAATEQRLREVLTAEEYEEYRLRHSPAVNVRSQLARMTLSESEARSIAKAVADKTETEARFDARNPTTKAAREQLEQRAQEQIQQLLGASRYAEYQRVSDSRYQQTAQIIERLQLPEPTTMAVYQTRIEAEKLAAQLRSNHSASQEERATALDVIRAEAEKSVRQRLGAEAFPEYQNHSGGWLQGLSPTQK